MALCKSGHDKCPLQASIQLGCQADGNFPGLWNINFFPGLKYNKDFGVPCAADCFLRFKWHILTAVYHGSFYCEVLVVIAMGDRSMGTANLIAWWRKWFNCSVKLDTLWHGKVCPGAAFTLHSTPFAASLFPEFDQKIIVSHSDALFFFLHLAQKNPWAHIGSKSHHQPP